MFPKVAAMGRWPPPIVKSRTVGRSAHKWPNAPGREGLGSKWGGNLKKCPKCKMAMNFNVLRRPARKRAKAQMANLFSKSSQKVGNVSFTSCANVDGKPITLRLTAVKVIWEPSVYGGDGTEVRKNICFTVDFP